MQGGQMKRRRGIPVKWIVLICAAAAVLTAVCAGLVWASYHRYVALPSAIQSRVDLLPDVNAREGTPNAGDVSEPLEGDSFQIVINQYPTMETGASPCNIEAENPETNPYDLRVSLYLQSTGELLGATHRIERGKRVDEITLNQVLPSGEYPVTAQLDLFDAAQQIVGQLAIDLTLRVLE